MYTPRSYFTSATEQRRALEACDIFEASELHLYDASLCAFDPSSSTEEAFGCFLYIYNELASPGPPSHWNVFRSPNPAPHWSAQQVFETIKQIKHGFPEFSPGGRVNLLNFEKSETAPRLQCCLEKMRLIKPNEGYPIMTVSKFLHFYNPALFPIYDTGVIYNKLLKGYFKSDFRDFCKSGGLPYKVFMDKDTVDFLPAYMHWARSLLSVAHGGFMQVFTDWLGEQPGADLSRRKLDPKTLYARAFEYTAVGAAKAEGW